MELDYGSEELHLVCYLKKAKNEFIPDLCTLLGLDDPRKLAHKLSLAMEVVVASNIAFASSISHSM